MPVTGCHEPWLAGFHHHNLLPPLRLQSVIETLEKLLPLPIFTSQYSPEAENPLGRPTGLAWYWAMVNEPKPLPLAVLVSGLVPMVATHVPVELSEPQFADAVVPGGAGGAGGA